MVAKVIDVPASDAKVGLKIDYLAKRLAAALKPLGFTRSGRTVLREGGEAQERHWCMVNLQAGPRNEGARGEFYVNLSLQFPAIERLLAQREGEAWRLDHVDKPEPTANYAWERLESLLHRQSAGHPLAGSGIQIRAGTDLAALGDTLVQAVHDAGWPWLQAHSSLQAISERDNALAAIAAALAAGDPAGAQQLVDRHASGWVHTTAGFLRTLRDWLVALRLDVGKLPTAPTPRPTSPHEVREQIRERAEDQTHAVLASALLAQAQADAGDLHTLAVAWVTEQRARWRSEPAPLTDLPSGQRVAALPPSERERVLLALLQHLVDHESRATRHPIQIDEKAFDLDEALRPPLQALLTTLPEASEATCIAVIEAMSTLTTRLRQDLVTATFPWGFVALVRWLITVGTPHRTAVAPAVERWMDALSRQVVAHHQRTHAALAIENAKPLDPADPSHEILLEMRQQASEAALKHPLADVLRRLADYPEQSLTADDKQAVTAWRRWLRRDPLTGALPVELESDDWGSAWNAAWAHAPAAMRAAATPIVQGWLEGVDGKPSARWLRGLKAQIAAMDRTDAAQAIAWREFVLQRLLAFATTSGQTEWATTGARPGVGARLGAGGQDVLCGLLWWTGCDAAIDAERRTAAWRSVAEAAWLHLPEVGARAATVGTLALRLLAGLGGASREYVEMLGSARKKSMTSSTSLSKQVVKAAERALADPLAP